MVKVERRLLLAGLGASAFRFCCPGCFAKSPVFIHDVLCATSAASGLEIGDCLTGTGDSDLDQSLVAEMNKQAAFFGYRPAFILYTGGAKNAAATREVMPQFSMAARTAQSISNLIPMRFSISATMDLPNRITTGRRRKGISFSRPATISDRPNPPSQSRRQPVKGRRFFESMFIKWMFGMAGPPSPPWR